MRSPDFGIDRESRLRHQRLQRGHELRTVVIAQDVHFESCPLLFGNILLQLFKQIAQHDVLFFGRPDRQLCRVVGLHHPHARDLSRQFVLQRP